MSNQVHLIEIKSYGNLITTQSNYFDTHRYNAKVISILNLIFHTFVKPCNQIGYFSFYKFRSEGMKIKNLSKIFTQGFLEYFFLKIRH